MRIPRAFSVLGFQASRRTELITTASSKTKTMGFGEVVDFIAANPKGFLYPGNVINPQGFHLLDMFSLLFLEHIVIV